MTLLDAVNLLKNTALPQSYDFDADLYENAGELHFFASTQEGLLWEGIIDAGKLNVVGMGVIDQEGAAALDLAPSGTYLGAAAEQVMLFKAN